MNAFGVNSRYTYWWSNFGNDNYTYFTDNQFQFLSDNYGTGQIINTDNGDSWTRIVQSNLYVDKNVGIGNTNPQGILDVTPQGMGTVYLRMTNDGELHYNYNDDYFLLDGHNRRFEIGDYTYDWYGTYIDLNDDVAQQYIFMRAHNGFTFNTGNTNRMFIDVNGNVGIGTSSPSTTLQVNGESSFYTTTTNTTGFEVHTAASGNGIRLHSDYDLSTIGFDVNGNNSNISLSVNYPADYSSILITTPIGFPNDSISLRSDSIILNGSVRLNTGTQANGYVLTSDASGNAQWQSVSAALSQLPSYANDADAAGGGVPVGGAYYNTTIHAYTKRES
jgi:hypothetical protein